MSREDGDAVSQEGMDDDVLASDIAIVGMAARLPDALTGDEYWSLSLIHI